jgi:DNA-3-methyladenine glycosylase I
MSFMDKPTSYCDAVLAMNKDNVHRIYHDNFYGFPIDNDDELFERLILEINQAGLSWDTILKKQVNFKKAYKNFNIKKVASFKENDFERLMNDAGIIRNRLKINAAIENAKAIMAIQKEFGSFKKWIDHHHPKTKDEWVKLFKKTFKFTGGEIVNEFLMSTGYLPGAHIEDCKVYNKMVKAGPAFLKK